jgi:S-adenosylmethionine hydrolase
VDRFGNLITDLPSEWIPIGTTKVRFDVANSRPATAPFVTHYVALPLGRLGVLPSSFGTLELALRTRPAAQRLRANVGDRVAIRGWEGRNAKRRANGK